GLPRGLLGGRICVRLVVEHIAALEHEARDLQHNETEDRDQHDRNDADVTERLHAARPLAFRRSEKACAASATALADEALGAGAGSSAGASSRCSEDRRAAKALPARRGSTAAPAASWVFPCA